MDVSSSLGRLLACLGTATSRPSLADAVAFLTAFVLAATFPVDVAATGRVFTLSALGVGTSSRALPRGGPLSNILSELDSLSASRAATASTRKQRV